MAHPARTTIVGTPPSDDMDTGESIRIHRGLVVMSMVGEFVNGCLPRTWNEPRARRYNDLTFRKPSILVSQKWITCIIAVHTCVRLQVHSDRFSFVMVPDRVFKN